MPTFRTRQHGRREEPSAAAGKPSSRRPSRWDNGGWGFGVSIVTRRDDPSSTPGRCGWDGGFGPSWYADPNEDLIGILMTQRVWDSPEPPAVLLDFWTSVYQAIDD
ncbi:MAG: beta-lactamase family protein [Chloroflexota bacterium]|nr:beta-lactamase family protein [Chloroflexota bacterium]